MDSTTKNDIRSWLERGKSENARWMIVACDTFDWGDYPVYIEDDPVKFWERHDGIHGKNMQKVMEVYDLKMDWETQLNKTRCHNEPPRPTKK